MLHVNTLPQFLNCVCLREILIDPIFHHLKHSKRKKLEKEISLSYFRVYDRIDGIRVQPETCTQKYVSHGWKMRTRS